MSVHYNSDFGATGNKSCILVVSFSENSFTLHAAYTEGIWLQPDRNDAHIQFSDLDNDGMPACLTNFSTI